MAECSSALLVVYELEKHNAVINMCVYWSVCICAGKP